MVSIKNFTEASLFAIVFSAPGGGRKTTGVVVSEAVASKPAPESIVGRSLQQQPYCSYVG